MKEGNEIRVTWKNDNMLLGQYIIEEIDFQSGTFIKFKYVKDGYRSSMLVDKRFHNVEVIK